MQTAFMILIGSVFVISIIFGILIWKQSVKFEKRALEAKKRKEQFIAEFEKQEEEK